VIDCAALAFLADVDLPLALAGVPPPRDRLKCFNVFLGAIPDGLLRRTSMVVEFEAYGLQARFWITSGLPTSAKLAGLPQQFHPLWRVG